MEDKTNNLYKATKKFIYNQYKMDENNTFFKLNSYKIRGENVEKILSKFNFESEEEKAKA